MKRERYSNYAKYLVLADNSRGRLKGTFIHYQNFKIVKELLSRISYVDKSTYSYENDIYKLYKTEYTRTIKHATI